MLWEEGLVFILIVGLCNTTANISFSSKRLYFLWYEIYSFLQECQRRLVQFLSFHGMECTADYRILQVSSMGLWLACGVPWSVLPLGAYGFNSYPSCCSPGVLLSTSRCIIVPIHLVKSTGVNRFHFYCSLVGSGHLIPLLHIGISPSGSCLYQASLPIIFLAFC